MTACYIFDIKADVLLTAIGFCPSANHGTTPKFEGIEHIFKALHWGLYMARVCQVTGKKPMVGHNVSHSNRKTKRRFQINLHVRRLWVATENRFVKLRITADGLRVIQKQGIDKILATLRQRGEKI